MKKNSSRENSWNDDIDTQPTPAGHETLDLALIAALLITCTISAGLISSANLTSPLAIISILLADGIGIFLVTPHLIAYWLGVDIDALLAADQSE